MLIFIIFLQFICMLISAYNAMDKDTCYNGRFGWFVAAILFAGNFVDYVVDYGRISGA